MRLPDLSGPELQRRPNELWSTLPNVFITGQADITTTVPGAQGRGGRLDEGLTVHLSGGTAGEGYLPLVWKCDNEYELLAGGTATVDRLL